VSDKTAYEQLKQRIEENAIMPDDPWDDENVQDLLRDMWKADGSWTEEEEAQYQHNLKLRAGIKPKNPTSASQTTQAPVPRAKPKRPKQKPSSRRKN
jgi:hypothetical protein